MTASGSLPNAASPSPSAVRISSATPNGSGIVVVGVVAGVAVMVV